MEKEADHDHVVYEFTCSDNGIGMSEAFIPHVFEMFSQENETCRSRYEGTGIQWPERCWKNSIDKQASEYCGRQGDFLQAMISSHRLQNAHSHS